MCGTGHYLIPLLEEANFESFSIHGSYACIFISTGLFCLLTTKKETIHALLLIKKNNYTND
ncbi:hypothetical protein pah_c197o110 [Parachlamydia acanthamoebae str. Hall's coccus]|nr:hypothetical protein pah_c197o110 [Parachlamydia acanthamoebae str. Hall's coccus]